jgi:hypothetical protein
MLEKRSSYEQHDIAALFEVLGGRGPLPSGLSGDTPMAVEPAPPGT